MNCTAGDPNDKRVWLPPPAVPSPSTARATPGRSPESRRRRGCSGTARPGRAAGSSCRSETTGLTCRNRVGHGFFLSRARWRLFYAGSLPRSTRRRRGRAPTAVPSCPASERGRPSSRRAISSGSCSIIVPTSVRTMWRRKLSAVISSSSASPRRCQAAARTSRTKTACCVSVGVKARKSCSPTGGRRSRRGARLVDRARVPPAAALLERRRRPAPPDPVAVAARPRRPAARRSRPATSSRGDHREVVGQHRVQRLGGAVRPAGRPRRRRSPPGRARARPRRSGRRRRGCRSGVQPAERLAQRPLDGPARPAAPPTRELGTVVLDVEPETHRARSSHSRRRRSACRLRRGRQEAETTTTDHRHGAASGQPGSASPSARRSTRPRPTRSTLKTSEGAFTFTST